jgi:tetratricopeptide (TPR) repeat protein
MYEEAIGVCEALRDRVATDSGVRRNLIDLYMKAGKYAAAERELTWLAENKPEAADVPATQGMVFMARGYMPQAAEQFGRAVKRDPDNPYLRLQSGQALAAIRRLDEADAELQKAHALAPDNVMIMMALAEFYVGARQRIGDAVTILEKAVRIDPNSAEARGKLGELYLYEQRIPEAERETAAASALQPEDGRLLCNLGIIMLHENREADAERILVEARERNATLPPPRYWLCLLYATQERVAEFNAEFQAFARMAPQFAQPLQMQAQALRTEAIRRRQFGQAFLWSEAMQAMAAGGRPAMAPGPVAPGGWQSPNGWQAPNAAAGNELEQAGEAVKAWWHKLTSG